MSLNSEKLLFCNIYRSESNTREQNNDIGNCFKRVSNLGYNHIIITGDFNRKHINWESITSPKNEDQAFLEAIRDSYLIQHQLTPTRGRGRDKPSLLDLVFTNVEHSIEYIDTHNPIGNSDHSIIKFGYRCIPEEMPPKITLVYDKADYNKMKEMLNINWQEEFKHCIDNVEDQWTIFTDKYHHAVNECVPKKIVRVGKKKFKHVLDKKTLAKKRKKYRLWQRFLQTSDGKIYTEYRRCSNQLRSLMRKVAKLQEKEIAKNMKKKSFLEKAF